MVSSRQDGAGPGSTRGVHGPGRGGVSSHVWCLCMNQETDYWYSSPLSYVRLRLCCCDGWWLMRGWSAISYSPGAGAGQHNIIISTLQMVPPCPCHPTHTLIFATDRHQLVAGGQKLNRKEVSKQRCTFNFKPTMCASSLPLVNHMYNTYYV